MNNYLIFSWMSVICCALICLSGCIKIDNKFAISESCSNEKEAEVVLLNLFKVLFNSSLLITWIFSEVTVTFFNVAWLLKTISECNCWCSSSGKTSFNALIWVVFCQIGLKKRNFCLFSNVCVQYFCFSLPNIQPL